MRNKRISLARLSRIRGASLEHTELAEQLFSLLDFLKGEKVEASVKAGMKVIRAYMNKQKDH